MRCPFRVSVEPTRLPVLCLALCLPPNAVPCGRITGGVTGLGIVSPATRAIRGLEIAAGVSACGWSLTRQVFADTTAVSADAMEVSADTHQVSADPREVSADTREVCADTSMGSADTSLTSPDTKKYPLTQGKYPRTDTTGNVRGHLPSAGARRSTMELILLRSSPQAQASLSILLIVITRVAPFVGNAPLLISLFVTCPAPPKPNQRDSTPRCSVAPLPPAGPAPAPHPMSAQGTRTSWR